MNTFIKHQKHQYLKFSLVSSINKDQRQVRLKLLLSEFLKEGTFQEAGAQFWLGALLLRAILGCDRCVSKSIFRVFVPLPFKSQQRVWLCIWLTFLK